MDIIEQLKRDEGLRLTPYKDTKGIWTVGYGHNLQAHNGSLVPISQEQADEWLEEDANNARLNVLKWLPWSTNLDGTRFGVLQNMAFNLGERLLQFHGTLHFTQIGDYAQASEQMLQSVWAIQVGSRARRLAQQMKTGVWV